MSEFLIAVASKYILFQIIKYTDMKRIILLYAAVVDVLRY